MNHHNEECSPEQTAMIFVSLLGAERGCQANVRYLQSMYEKSFGEPVPLHGSNNLVEFLKEQPYYFDVRPNRNGGYQVFLTEFPDEQAATIANWNTTALQRRKKKTDAQKCIESPMKNRTFSNLDSPKIVEFVKRVGDIAKVAASDGRPVLPVDDLIDMGDPVIRSVDPFKCGFNGYLELLQLTAGKTFTIEYEHGAIVIKPIFVLNE